MEKDVQKLIDAGQTEDTVIVHAAPGEMVVPPVISNQTQQMINQDMQSVGLNPAEYMVGQGSINNLTGLQEFGFLSKLFKKVKKVVKKVAPIAVSFIPGIGPVAKGALTAVAGKASGLSTKEALLGGLTAGVGAKIAAGRAAAAGTAGAAGKVAEEAAKKGIFGGTLGPRIRSGLGSFFKPGEDATGIFGGKLGPNIRSGIGNVFSGGLGGGQQLGQITTGTGEFGEPIYTAADGTEVTAAQLQEAGYTFDASGNPIAPTQTTGPFGGTLGPKLRETFLGTGDQPGLIGNILSGGQQTGTQQGGGFGLGGAGGIAGLAALYGLATKKAAEKTEGGLRDIRLSTRPDLMPQQVFQGFDVGVRPGMKEGTTVFNINERDPKNEAFAFRILQSNNPSITIQGLDEIDKQKFEHGLIMGGEFGVFSDIVRGTDYTPSSKFQDIMRAHAKGIADINRGMAYGGRMDEQELDMSMGGPMNNRPGFALGTGVDVGAMMEQDMRPGGPSVGPGTETSDDIPAMLSDGEFVHTAKANKGLGGFKIEKNKDSITLYPAGKPDREQGFKNNDMMMKMFEDYQEMVS